MHCLDKKNSAADSPILWEKLWIGCVLLFFCQLTFSQDTTPTPQNFHQWGSVTLFNGLPSDSVRSIEQTADGILWFGTDSGLARFDGRRIQTIAIPDAVSNRILALRLAPDNSLLIGTESGAFRLVESKFEKIAGTDDLAVTAILIDSQSLLATGNGLLLRVTQGEDGSLSAEKLFSDAMVGSDGLKLKFTSLVSDGTRVIVGTSSRSIMVWEAGQLLETRSSPRPFFVNALVHGNKGGFWLGAGAGGGGSGLYLVSDILRPVKIDNGAGDVLALATDKDGGLWAGTKKNGLFHFRDSQEVEHFTFENTSGSLRSNTVYSIFVDREGVLWVGTSRGICRYDRSSPFQQLLSDNANSNFVRTLFRTRDGRILAGTNHGLFVADGNSWKELPAFAQKVVYSIDESGDGSIMFGTATGVVDGAGKSVHEGDARGVVHFQGKIYSAIYRSGLVEIGDDGSDSLVFANDSPTALFADADRLLIGTARSGVFVFNGRETRPLIQPELLDNSPVRKLIRGIDNSIWIACDSGLFFYDNGQIERVIAANSVRDIAISERDVWAATSNGGLLHAVRNDLFGWLVSNLSVEQGLPSEKSFALLSLGGELLIGTNRGVVRYSPSEVPPKLVLVRVLSRRLYEPEELRSKIELEYPQNSLLIEVAGQSSRTFPEEFRYAFILKNGRGEIIDKRIASAAEFSPGNLRPGDYSIEAQAFDRDLVSSEPLIINFSVARAPFPWTSTALALLLAIALVALVWVIIERRRIGQRNRELAAARFDLANEAERERRRIARDLHDQTLADLRNLMLKSDQFSSDNSEYRAEIESVSTEIRRICEDLSPSVLENVGLIAALEFLLSHTIENHQFSAAENLEERIRFSTNDQLQIYRIIQEVLNNIKRHSDATSVKMSVEVDSALGFLIRIVDDGSGFTPDNVDTADGRGITNIRSRASLIDAQIDWQQGETSGTCFVLSIHPDR